MAEEKESEVENQSVEAMPSFFNDLVSSTPTLSGDKEFTELLDKSDVSQQRAEKAEVKDDAVDDAEEEKETEVEAEVESETEEDEESETEEDEESEEVEDEFDAIFGTNESKEKPKKEKLDFEVQPEMSSLIKKKYGVDDVSTFLGSVDTWRSQAQESSEVKTQYDAIVSDLNALPSELMGAITSWAEGGDYKEALNKKRLDYSVSFEKQDLDGLVQQYFSEDYSDMKSQLDNSDITDDEFEKSIKLLGKSAKKLFESDKKSLEIERVQYEARQKDDIRKMKTSALDSVKSFSKTHPNFRKSEIDKIRNIMINQEADDLLYASDGLYREDTAEKIAFILYGKKMLERITKQAESKGASKARKEVVDTSDKTLKKTRQTASEKADMSSLRHLQGVVQPDPFANQA